MLCIIFKLSWVIKLKNEIDSKTILAVYEHIQKKGNNNDEGKFYQGITAFSDIDGYTIYLKGSGVLMRYGFHNTYHLDYDHLNNKEQFLTKLDAIKLEIDRFN